MHAQPQTPHVHHDPVCVRVEVCRSSELENSSHRQSADAGHSGLRQGEEGTPSAALAQTVGGTANLLEGVSANRSAVSGKNTREDLRRHVDPQSDQEVCKVSRDSQEHLSARAAEGVLILP